MKTTIDIATSLFKRSKKLAEQEQTTFRSLVEEGLARVLDEHHQRRGKFKLPRIPLGSGGFTAEFEHAGWDALRDQAYQGRGA